jgi:hypothetical protein
MIAPLQLHKRDSTNAIASLQQCQYDIDNRKMFDNANETAYTEVQTLQTWRTGMCQMPGAAKVQIHQMCDVRGTKHVWYSKRVIRQMRDTPNAWYAKCMIRQMHEMQAMRRMIDEPKSDVLNARYAELTTGKSANPTSAHTTSAQTTSAQTTSAHVTNANACNKRPMHATKRQCDMRQNARLTKHSSCEKEWQRNEGDCNNTYNHQCPRNEGVCQGSTTK